MNKLAFLCVGLIFSTALMAQSVTGKWKTIDDGSGEVKSIVNVYMKGGKLYGDIVKLVNEDPNYDPLCTACPGKLKDQKILGMTIINGLEKKEDYWYAKHGIIDPDNGKWYDVKIWREGDQLKVRGYISFLFRTQTWLMVE